MHVKVTQYQGVPTNAVVKLRCAVCRQRGTFDPIGGQDVQLYTQAGQQVAGYRRCPDPSCQALILFVARGSDLTTFPAERTDFDSTNIPATVLVALEEAVTDHANQCFISAAIMVRKTLEELCLDQG